MFELLHQLDGSWTENILHNFKASPEDGANPQTPLILDTSGNLYGTTHSGGTGDGTGAGGTVFELSPTAGGAWTEKIFSVYSSPVYGVAPQGLAIDARGNLYGTSYEGTNGARGNVFELTPEPNGNWTETILHQFIPYGQDGYDPSGGLIFDAEGNLYGTTFSGGAYADGTVFKIAAASVANGPLVTTTTLVINPDTNLVAGQPITLTATVTPSSGAAFPTGSVTFSDPAFPSRQVAAPLNSMGQAVYHGTVPPTGSYSVVANYTGASGFVSSTSPTITRTVH